MLTTSIETLLLIVIKKGHKKKQTTETETLNTHLHVIVFYCFGLQSWYVFLQWRVSTVQVYQRLIALLDRNTWLTRALRTTAAALASLAIVIATNRASVIVRFF